MTASIMLDLETISTRPNAAITSIGAVAFDPKGGLGREFYARLDTVAQVRTLGRDIDPGTFAWWCGQPDAARAVFKEPAGGVVACLNDFRAFVAEVSAESLGGGMQYNCEMWGYGADFDCVVLGGLYEAAGVPRPWSYSSNRCHRTLVKLANGAALPERKGTHHNALDDAKYQAECAIVLLNLLGV